jgi:phospholipase/carboxylesterase
MLDGPVLMPTSGKVKSLVVLSHGYGSNGDDLINLGKTWQPFLPDTVFVAPNAPEKSPHPGGYQWFPINSFSKEERLEGTYKAAPILEEYIDQCLKEYGVSPDKLALVGFSQGTMLSLHIGLRRKDQIAGILGFSGALAAPEKMIDEMKTKPPIFLIHGAMDNVIPFPAIFEAVGALEAAGINVEKHISQNTAHGIAQDGMEKGGAFLAQVLA